jgi:alkanesulfonate monooxygenase SsuD/methylene tetrahydromethanopterin reductase-like flavin-dependent oxidoreductase (luciferase family)
LKVGLQLYHFHWPGSPQNIGPKLVEIAKVAESSGFSSLWVMDHWFQLGQAFGPADAPMLEAYSAISYMAAATRKIKVGVLVTNNICRHPAILVKTVSTLDVLSNGRSYLGIGPGGMMEREMKGLGIPNPPLKERIERLEETLQIFHQMWRDDDSPFIGKYYQLAQPISKPQPLAQPHPPIMIGMWKGGEKMVKMTAKYADACNLQFGSPLKEFPSWMRARYEEFDDFARNRLAALKRNCERLGRPYESIERTTLGTIRVAPDAMALGDVVRLCQKFNRLGFEHVIFNMPNAHEIEPIQTVGNEIIPAVTGFVESSSRCG